MKGVTLLDLWTVVLHKNCTPGREEEFPLLRFLSGFYRSQELSCGVPLTHFLPRDMEMSASSIFLGGRTLQSWVCCKNCLLGLLKTHQWIQNARSTSAVVIVLRGTVRLFFHRTQFLPNYICFRYQVCALLNPRLQQSLSRTVLTVAGWNSAVV